MKTGNGHTFIRGRSISYYVITREIKEKKHSSKDGAHCKKLLKIIKRVLVEGVSTYIHDAVFWCRVDARLKSRRRRTFAFIPEAFLSNPASKNTQMIFDFSLRP